MQDKFASPFSASVPLPLRLPTHFLSLSLFFYICFNEATQIRGLSPLDGSKKLISDKKQSIKKKEMIIINKKSQQGFPVIHFTSSKANNCYCNLT